MQTQHQLSVERAKWDAEASVNIMRMRAELQDALEHSSVVSDMVDSRLN